MPTFTFTYFFISPPFWLYSSKVFSFLQSNMLIFKSLVISVSSLLVLQRVNCEITFDTASCVTTGLQPAVSSAFDEMVAMAAAAYSRSDGTLRHELPLGNMRVVENTFRTYFGPISVPNFPVRYDILISKRFLNAYSVSVS